MRDSRHPRVSGVLALLALFLIPAVPMAAYLWGALNEVLAGHVVPIRLLVALPVLLVFLWLVRVMSGRIRRLTLERGR